MLKANYGVVFFLTVLVPLALTQNCDFDAVHAKLNRCSKVELAISPSTAEAYLNERCQDVECSIRCVRDAVGNCHKSDAFFNFDPATIKVAFRMECNNSKVLANVFKDCWNQMYIDNTCLSQLRDPWLSALQRLETGDYATYKSASCSAFATYTACLERSPIRPSGKCTSELASFATDALIVSYSYSTCGKPSKHQFFTKYDGDVTCGASPLVIAIAYGVFTSPLLFYMLFY